MPTFGSNGGFQADNRGGIIDQSGNNIISSDNTFAASPLGIAARTQALYGIPNANFNLTPPNPNSPIVTYANELPYWSIENLSDDQMTATTVFDSATQTWGVELNPGTAASGSTLSLTTRSYLITDDNLALRQKALAVLSKSGTAAVSTEWNLTLSAIYYSAADTALSTAFIGTALDTGTWTSMSGTTTPGGSAINAAAQYVDLTFTLTTTAAVTGSAKATIKSLLLQTSSASSGSFQVADVFTSNGTWTRPAGVSYVSLVMFGGGGGGAGGAGTTFIGAGGGAAGTTGAGGGGGSRIYLIDNVYVDQATYSIGVGSGGSGGTATTVTRAAGGSNSPIGNTFTAGSNGGASSFGSLVSVGGGVAANSRTGGAGANATTTVFYGGNDSASFSGGSGGSGTAVASRDGGTAAGGAANTYIAGYQSAAGTGASGASATTSGAGGTVDVGTAAAGGTGFIGGAGAAAYVYAGGANPNFVGNASAGSAGAGGGGASAAMRTSTAGTYVITGGAGGNAAANSGAGGGGGGGYAWASGNSTSSTTSLTMTAGKGGDGGAGAVIVLTVR